VRKWISYHGIAINVSTDLSYFKAISPCGQDGSLMSSLAELLETPPPMDEVKAVFVESLRQEFDLEHQTAETAPAHASKTIERRARPAWLRVKAPGSPEYQKTLDIVREHKLVTVCEEARCPNMGECWSHHTATFMIMGELCTRRCSFCSVRDGTLDSLDPLDPLEPLRAAQAVSRLGLKHVVITSVNRDDLPDMGARHFDQTVRAIRHLNPDCDVELLIPDMRGRRELVEIVLSSGGVRVLNHNTETIPRLYRRVRPGAVFKRSLDILRWAKELDPSVRTKSGLMVGLGEEREEILAVMDALRESRVEVLTIGQYLQPTEKQLPIQRYVTPEEFELYRLEGIKRGFLHVESGPLVRSSYHAWQHTGEETAGISSPVRSDALLNL
jgi:lipoic acid synthetase